MRVKQFLLKNLCLVGFHLLTLTNPRKVVLSPVRSQHSTKITQLLGVVSRRSFKQTKNDTDSDKNISISPLARFLHNRIQNLDSYEIILTRQHHSDCRPCPKLPSNMVKEDGVQTHVLLLLQVSRKAKKGD